MAYSDKKQGFLLTASILRPSGDYIDCSKMISDIRIKKDYISASFPLCMISFNVTVENRDILRDEDIEISLSVEAYNSLDSDVQETDGEDIVTTDEVLSTIIRPYEKPYDVSDVKDDEDNEDSENIGIKESVNTVSYTVSGIPKSLIIKNKSIINTIYDGATINDILVNILSDIDTSDILIEPSDNGTSYENIIIPPLSPIAAIKYLDNFYGIYNENLGIFLDNTKSYVYPLNKANRDYYSNTLEIYIKTSNETSNNDIYTNAKLDDDNNIRVYKRAVPSFVETKKVTGDTIATNTVFYSYDENYNLVTRGETYDMGYEKNRYYWNTGSNAIAENKFSANALAEASAISIPNINPEIFTPMTKAMISGDTSDTVNGEYFIGEVSYILSSSDFLHFNASTILKLIKTS